MKWLVLLLLAGCTTFEADNKHLNQYPVISWIIVDDVKQFCGNLTGTYSEACSIHTDSGSRCVIFTGKITQEYYLGHEARHCFKGNFHN